MFTDCITKFISVLPSATSQTVTRFPANLPSTNVPGTLITTTSTVTDTVEFSHDLAPQGGVSTPQPPVRYGLPVRLIVLTDQT